jgi:cytidyltransferase-like protein
MGVEMKHKPLILLSGGFDPYHDGHARMFMAAAELGGICVILNSDDWLVYKKGRNFMTATQRADVLNSVRGVEWVWHSDSMDDVTQDIVEISKHPNFTGRSLIFGKGGDRNATNTPEASLCEKLGIPVLYGLGGNNKQSRS